MISRESYKKVTIHITTYRNRNKNKKTNKRAMDCCQNERNNRFICSLCLNLNNSHNNVCENKYAKPCPICFEKHTCNNSRVERNKCPVTSNNNNASDKRNGDENARRKRENKDNNTKTVQTSQTDLTQDLSLLQEVLTVFQSKKQIDIQNNSKTILMKDVSIATDTKSNIELKPKLTKSRVFQFSIEDDKTNNCNHFKIVNFSQPDNIKSSANSIDLIKHKSSSIPQMKLEELKYSLKEKTKSKDAIEEVNRMFATVRRTGHDMPDLEELNRPLIRNGPRVLPVVKTKTDLKKKDSSNYEGERPRKILPVGSNNSFENNRKSCGSKVDSKSRENSSCKCCQTKNKELSGGDSFFKHECCYHKMSCEGKCEKCIYMLCCHYQKQNKTETGALICDYCNNTQEIPKERCEGNNCGQF